MRYGFVIDHNRCIGCHACTVACKEEHDVPIGVYRTWVKYVEKGEFPDSKRYFGVLRCNHCDDAPCIEICPTVALYRRADGIVDFDGARCIGCKSCMQACPYDALYIDPNTQTAAKCNFCAHRVDIGLEPACVIVCPEQAIIAGDLDDPQSKISRVRATQTTSARKPEKGTKPKLFYVGIDEALLDPAKTELGTTHLWAEKSAGEDLYALREQQRKPGTHAAGAVREVYDVPHPTPWGSGIASYLWTKSIASGVLLVASLLFFLGRQEERMLLNIVSPLLALVFVAVTTLLLVFDLKRPERFFYLLTKPNPRSWLVLGGYILVLYSVLAALWLFSGAVFGYVPNILAWPTALLAAGSAGYSAFLFGQAKGRDLWQSRLLFWHLLAQALVAGAATMLLTAVLLGTETTLRDTLADLLRLALFLDLALTLGEVTRRHASEDAQRAAEILTRGPLCGRFWTAAVGAGLFLPLVLLFWPAVSVAFTVLASVAALTGLWFYEDLWIRAGQALPLS
jgi:Fe-S-cluster-containing dehydrogenase component/formate-dependent nitrite reductase membrane component NrfD